MDEPSTSCDESPALFAEICSFLKHFGKFFEASDVGYNELEEMVGKRRVPQRLVRLHITLLTNYFKTSISTIAWERFLAEFSTSFGYHDECGELEAGGYFRLSLESKLKLLKTLLEAQFDCNPSFKSQVDQMKASTIREQPLGRDYSGNVYWCQAEGVKFRIYKDNVEEEEWDTVLTDKAGLDKLVAELRA